MAWLANHPGDVVAAAGSVMPANSASLYGLRDVRIYDPSTANSRARRYWNPSGENWGYDGSIPATALHVDTLAAAGVRHVVTTDSETVPGTRPVLTAEGVVVAEAPGALPVAYLAAAPDSAAPGRVELVGNPTPETYAITCFAAQPATLVLLQSFDPDWQATVDGTRVEVAVYNTMFQSVRVPPGHHLVRFEYRPWAVSVGLWASAASLLLLGALLILWKGAPTDPH